MTIWTFKLPLDDEVFIEMPEGARVLHVETQGKTPCIWAAVDEQHAPMEKRRFYIRGTGHPLGMAAVDKHVGSFQIVGSIGVLVFHVFDGGSAEGPF